MPASTLGSHVHDVRLSVACRSAMGSALNTLLDDRLGEQPETRHRIEDHGGNPGPLGAPPLGLGSSRPPEIPMSEHDGGDMNADDQQDLEVPDERRWNEISVRFILDGPKQVERATSEWVRGLVDEQLSVDGQVTEVMRQQVPECDRHQRWDQSRDHVDQWLIEAANAPDRRREAGK